MLKKFIAFLVLMMVLGMGVFVVASDAVDADYDSNITLECLGIEVEMRISLDPSNESMPQLRRTDQRNSLEISTESDVRVLLDTLAMLFEITDSSVYVDGEIITALNEAGLREYWSQGVRELLQEERSQLMTEHAEEQVARSRPSRTVQIPVATLRSGEVWTSNAITFSSGTELEFLINSILDQGVQGILDVGSFCSWWQTRDFNFFRALQPRLNQWRVDHFVIIARHPANHSGHHQVAFRNRASGASSLRFQGTMWIFD